jgi:hypothetical protein
MLSIGLENNGQCPTADQHGLHLYASSGPSRASTVALPWEPCLFFIEGRIFFSHHLVALRFRSRRRPKLRFALKPTMFCPISPSSAGSGKLLDALTLTTGGRSAPPSRKQNSEHRP